MDEFIINGNSDIAKGDDNARIAFYANIGFFIEVAQMLEYNLRKLLCYEKSVKEIETGELTKRRISKICKKYDKYYDDTYIQKLTLGKLIRRLEKEDELLKDFIVILKEINDFRAKIVHSIFQINIVNTNLGKPQTVRDYTNKRLIPMTNKAIELNKAIINIMGEYKTDLHEYKLMVGMKLI